MSSEIGSVMSGMNELVGGRPIGMLPKSPFSTDLNHRNAQPEQIDYSSVNFLQYVCYIWEVL